MVGEGVALAGNRSYFCDTDYAGVSLLRDFAAGCRPECPFAVRLGSFSCSARCVATFADCLAQNENASLQQPGDFVCNSFSLRLCKRYLPTNGHMCAPGACHEGFTNDPVAGGPCVPSDAKPMEVVLAVFVAVMVPILVTLIYQGARNHRKHSMYRKSGGSAPLLGQEEAEQVIKNEEALEVGDELAKRTSIAAHARGFADYDTEDVVGQVKPACLDCWLSQKILKFHRWLHMRTDSVQVGIGLVLFFNTQAFLIIVCLIFYLVMRHVERVANTKDLIRSLSESSHLYCDAGKFEDMFDKVEIYADVMSAWCFIFWLLLLAASWIFTWAQSKVMADYDKDHATFEDYTLMLKGLPSGITSEQTLKDIVVHKLQVEPEDIYGTLVMIDARESGAKIQRMADRLTEFQDERDGWCPLRLSQPGLKEEVLQRAPAEFQRLQQKVKGSGIAFVVFKRQVCAQDIVDTRDGFIIYDHELTEKYTQGAEAIRPEAPEDEERRTHPARYFAKKLAGKQGMPVTKKYLVRLTATDNEPHGIAWEFFGISKDEVRLRIAGLYAATSAAYLVFVAVSYYADQIIMQPYLRIGIPPDQNDFALQVVVAGLGVVNAVAQMLAQEGVALMGFLRHSSRDRFLMRFDFVVQALNVGVMIFFFAFCGEFEMNISKSQKRELNSEFSHSLFLESAFASNLANLLVTNLLSATFIANLVLSEWFPPRLMWFLMMVIYKWRPQGLKCLFSFLKGILLREPASLEKLQQREAELNLEKPPLLISLKYSFALVYPLAAFIIMFLFTDEADTIALYLLVFCIFFFVCQRFVSTWWLRVSASDSVSTFNGFMNIWGWVVSVPPTAAWTWQWRLRRPQDSWRILGFSFSWVSPILVYLLAYVVYLWVVLEIRKRRAAHSHDFDGDEDHERANQDDIQNVIDARKLSWWNMNPYYVLKLEYLKAEDARQMCHDRKVGWASGSLKRFLEVGREFRDSRRQTGEASRTSYGRILGMLQ